MRDRESVRGVKWGKLMTGSNRSRRTRRPHEDLEVYRLAHDLCRRVHAVSLKLPTHELYEEGSQSRRSSKSISSQIVEGHALRRYKPEYLHYLWRAYASAEETIEHISTLIERLALPKQSLENAKRCWRSMAYSPESCSITSPLSSAGTTPRDRLNRATGKNRMSDARQGIVR